MTSEARAALSARAGGAAMEPVREARQLVCWAAEEMEAPEAARAQQSTLRR